MKRKKVCSGWRVSLPSNTHSFWRIGKAGEKELHQVRGIAKGPLEILPGDGDCALVCTGSVLRIALEAAKQLESQGVKIAVYSCPWLQPVTPEFFQSLNRFKRLVAVEEHLQTGGLGSLLRDTLSPGIRVDSLPLPAGILGSVGSQEYLRRNAGLTVDALTATILAVPR